MPVPWCRSTFFLQIATKWRADERTRTAYPCSLRVRGRAFLSVARAGKSRIGIGFPVLYIAPVLPTIAGYCVRVRVKLGLRGVGSPWITRRRFLCKPDLRPGYSQLTRCTDGYGDPLPATGRVYARWLPPPALHMAMSIFINVEPREFGPLDRKSVV